MPPGRRAEGGVLEVALEARRGSFHLQVECRLESEWTVAFGPSGAGKSTLLRLLAGLDRETLMAHSRARVAHAGETLADSAMGMWRAPGRRNTALVAQQPALFPHLSVLANVAYGVAHLDRGRRAARAEEMLELVGARELVARRTQGLSGGEAQRVALARALAPDPKLLLLDEPFSALDGAAADALLDRLHAWTRARGIQTIQATHDATDAFITNAEVVLLHEGRVAAQGPAAEVLSGERARLLGWLEG